MTKQEILYPYSWSLDKTETKETIIRAYALSEKDENVCLTIKGFRPHIYIELPQHIKWDNSKCNLVCGKLMDLTGLKNLSGSLVYRKKLYYFHSDESFPYIYMNIDHLSFGRTLLYKTSQKIYVAGIGPIQIKIHEHDADSILQFLTEQDIRFCNWCQVLCMNSPEKVTSCDRELVAMSKNIHGYTSKRVANPLILSFDIESYSVNHMSSKPDPTHPGNKTFQISCILWRHGSDDISKYILTLGKLDEKKTGDDVNIIEYKNEHKLLLGFKDFLREHNPNVIIGFNIFGYDIPYLYGRAKHLNIVSEFSKQGFLLNGEGSIIAVKWSSSAFKNQSFEYLDVEGRVWVDFLPLIRRDYPNFSTYTLKAVATNILKTVHKDPLSIKDMWEGYDIVFDPKSKASISKKKKILSAIAKYCVQDSFVVLKLCIKLHSWIGLCEMASICNVSIFTLFTQGQQIRVFSQVYANCKNEYVIDSKNYISSDDNYQGATVVDPIPGVYNKVVPFDFSSLYPTTQIAYNIDYSTLVVDDTVPDSLCHVMEWEDHVGCPHDKKVVRKDEINVCIQNVNDQVKKIRDQSKLKEHRLNKEYYASKIEELKKSLDDIKDEKKKYTTKPKHIICATRKFRFIKSPLGVLPSILKGLLDARKKMREEIKKLKNDLNDAKTDEEKNEIELQMSVLDRRQNACKISANSVYGSMGAKKGYLPFLPGAMCTTAMGRKNIGVASSSIQNDWKGQLVYGDSVTRDTPILLRQNGKIVIKSIEDINSEWKKYDVFKFEQYGLTCKQQSKNSIDYEVWTDNGWTKIKRVIRHKTDKKIYEVSTHSGYVKVTEDHSLLTPDLQQLKPKECKIGIELLHSFPEIKHSIVNNVTTEKAYKCGLFFGNGCKDLNLIDDTECCDKYGNKIIPEEILNGSVQDKQNFLVGYYDATKDYRIESQISGLHLYFLIKSLGINVYIDKSNETNSYTMITNAYIKNPNKIKNINLVSEKNHFKQFVYDLETEVGHFHAGVGSMIVKNTDSAYISFDHCKTAEECWDYAVNVSNKVSTLFPKPMKLEFEEKIYWKFMIITKKRYMCLVCKKDGVIEDQMNKKGVLLTRRDNCKFVRDVYEKTVHDIFNGKSFEEITQSILHDLSLLFSNSFPIDNFLVTKSVGSTGNLKMVVGKNEKGKPMGYIGDYAVRLLPENNEEKIKKMATKNCTSEDEFYIKSLPSQVQLVEKMRRRGNVVDAGTRVEYIITEQGGYDASVSEKIESYEYFNEHKDILKIDHLYYLKQLATSLDQILLIIFHKRNFLQNQYKLRCKRKDCLDQLMSLFRPTIIFN